MVVQTTPAPLVSSPEAETTVIGGCMLVPDRVEDVAQLGPEHFVDDLHARIWTIILARSAARMEIDPVSVATAYRATHGDTPELLQRLSEMTETTPYGANVEAYARTLEACLRARKTIGVGRRIVASADADAGIQALIDLDQDDATRWETGPGQIAPIVRELLDGDRPVGLQTGFPLWDAKGGLRNSQLIVGVARPRMGKTALALNIVATVSDQCPVLVISCEDTAEANIARLISARSGVPLTNILTRQLGPQDYSAIADATAWLDSAGVYIIDRASASLDDVQRAVRRHVHRHGVGLVVLDYLQLMDIPKRAAGYVEGVMHNVDGLAAIARQHRIPVLALAQADRKCDLRKGAEQCPELGDIQWASRVEQTAHFVFGLWRERAADPMSHDRSALVRVLKHRHGTVGEFRLEYHEETVRFAPQADRFERFPL